ncbi:hypothetical protein [Streptomyces sp. NPDC051684]|uniref:hypothetical protein n=1 Tax=Streptomyces sp. NPDC051684 TaxID=3365670 RepID=UPI0037A89ED5
MSHSRWATGYVMTPTHILSRFLGLAVASLTVAAGALTTPAAALEPSPTSDPLPTLTVDRGYEDENPSGKEGGEFDGDARLLDASGKAVGRFFYDCTTQSPGKTTVGALDHPARHPLRGDRRHGRLQGRDGAGDLAPDGGTGHHGGRLRPRPTRPRTGCGRSAFRSRSPCAAQAATTAPSCA